MADKKISELPAATEPLNDADLVEIVQGGVNKKAPKSAFSGGAVDSVNGQTGVVVLDAVDVGADPAGSASTVATNLSNHISDTSDAHDASAISFAAAGTIAATDVQAAIVELDTKTIYKEWQITDDVTAIGASTTVPKKTFYLPVAVTVDSLLFSLTTAQASGAIFTIDIHINGTTIFSTKPTIDNTENLSSDATTPAVMSDNTWDQYAKVEVFVDQIGNGSAIELIMYTGWH